MNNWLNIIQNKLLPPRCILCGRPGCDDLDLCAGCLADLPRNLHCCYRCGESFAMPISAPQLCGRCLKNTPGFDETQAPFLYDSAMRYLIAQLKFHQQYKIARLLGSLLARHIAAACERPQCLIAVPLHRHRYLERGFNQSLEIARHVSRQLSIPIDYQHCIRRRDTGHQTDLAAKQRRNNMKGAFALTAPLAYRHVAIIDDVMTTGATLDALATALKRSGIERVDAWSCARA